METALHKLVVRVEKVFDQQEISLGVFLVIVGALDNTTYDSKCSTVTRHGVDQTIVRWIRTTLEGRITAAAFGGVSRSVGVSRGCPQGGLFPTYGALL